MRDAGAVRAEEMEHANRRSRQTGDAAIAVAGALFMVGSGSWLVGSSNPEGPGTIAVVCGAVMALAAVLDAVAVGARGWVAATAALVVSPLLGLFAGALWAFRDFDVPHRITWSLWVSAAASLCGFMGGLTVMIASVMGRKLRQLSADSRSDG